MRLGAFCVTLMANACYITSMVQITGASVCLLSGENVVTILRDNHEGLAYANFWDFPGGALELGEDPLTGGLREVLEETSLIVHPSTIDWEQTCPFERRQGAAQFMVAMITCLDLLKLGTEGQETRLMPIVEFLERSDVVPAQQQRLRDYLQFRQTTPATALETILPRQREEVELHSA